MKLPQVNSRYGAPMGRSSISMAGNVGDVRFHVQYMPLNSGGYDRGGAYWGVRYSRLYWCYVTSADKQRVLIQEFIGAYSRDEAKDKIKALYPDCKFYR